VNVKQLYQSLQQNGIKFYDYKIGMAKAITLEVNQRYGIFVDTSKIESKPEEYCIMAHEGGHCATGCTHKVSSPLDLVEKHEYKADKWAVHKILPIDDFKQALRHGHTEIWDLAEYFGVTEDFMHRAIYIYQCEELL
jgi:hypothetical protein